MCCCNTPLINLLALTLGVSVGSSSPGAGSRLSILHFITDFKTLSLSDSIDDRDRIIVIDAQLQISLLQILLGGKIA